MAEVNNGDELTLPTKRCSDFTTQDPTNNCPKKQKLNDNETNDKPITNDVVQSEEKEHKPTPQDQEQNEHHSNDNPVIDRKGKGILIEEDDDDDDDDDSGSDSDSGSGSDVGDNLSDDSDFADDPLAEVDLENILPSRTRRRSIQPGAYIANDLADQDSDESDDPDA